MNGEPEGTQDDQELTLQEKGKAMHKRALILLGSINEFTANPAPRHHMRMMQNVTILRSVLDEVEVSIKAIEPREENHD